MTDYAHTADANARRVAKARRLAAVALLSHEFTRWPTREDDLRRVRLDAGYPKVSPETWAYAAGIFTSCVGDADAMTHLADLMANDLKVGAAKRDTDPDTTDTPPPPTRRKRDWFDVVHEHDTPPLLAPLDPEGWSD